MRINLSPNRYLPLKLILMIEILLVAVFFAFVIWFQTTDGIGMENIRFDLVILAFHAGVAGGIITALEHPGSGLPYLPIVWICMAFATDLWSVLNSQLHLSKIVGIVGDCFTGLATFAIIYICLSGTTIVYYSILLFWQMIEQGRSGKAEKALKRTMSKEDSSERLLMAGNIRHGFKL